jgi:hypothetical protein
MKTVPQDEPDLLWRALMKDTQKILSRTQYEQAANYTDTVSEDLFDGPTRELKYATRDEIADTDRHRT